MGDKWLGVKEWKAVSKDRPVKADALTRSLTAWEASERAAPGERLGVLEELQKLAKGLLKAHAGDATLAKHLAEMDKAATTWRRELEKEHDRLAAEQAAREAKLAKDAKDAKDDRDDKPEVVPAAVLLDPKKLLDQLNQCKRDPERRAPFAFTDASEKDGQRAVLALAPRGSGRGLFAQLQEATGVKAGAYGTAWIAGTELMLRLEKNFSGLAKKAWPSVKQAGFRVTKIVVWDEKGQRLEDGGDDDATGPADSGVKAAVKGYLETLPDDLRLLAVENREAAAVLAPQLKRAIALAQSGALDEAQAALADLAQALGVARGRQRADDAAAQIPTGIVAERVQAIELAAVEWQVGRMRAVDGLAELVAVLMTEDDPDLLEIAARVAEIADRIPEAIAQRLEALRGAVEAGDADATQSAKAAMLGELRDAAGVLKDEAVALRNCEDNPFGIPVRVVAPLADALKAIQAAVARV